MLVSVAIRCCLTFSPRRFDQLLALPGRVGDHQPAAVQHADELLQLLGANRLRRKLALETIGDLVQARLPVEHLQNGELFFLEAEVLQADWVFHHPVNPPLVPMPAGAQIGPLANRQPSRRAGNQTFGKSGHGRRSRAESQESRARNTKACIEIVWLLTLDSSALDCFSVLRWRRRRCPSGSSSWT